MTPGARLAAAIEVLDRIAASRGPADEALKAWGRAHRFAGSGDRRAIAGRVYDILRARTRLAWAMGGETGRALAIGALSGLDGLAPEAIAALFSGEGYAPAPLTADERARLAAPPASGPAWVEAGVPAFVADALETRFGPDWLAEARALTADRAPVDLRVNTLRGGVDQAVSLLGVDGVKPARTPFSALGLRLPPALATDIQSSRAFRTGWVEVQDEASQVAAALAGARPGMTVIDYCAGAGGKTLALGAAMRPLPPRGGKGRDGGVHVGKGRDGGVHVEKDGDGAGVASSPSFPVLAGRTPAPDLSPFEGERSRLVALDISAGRLESMCERLQRADVLAEIRTIGPAGEGTEDLHGRADLVFVDAPCSGSGTWRRHPEGAWRLAASDVERLSVLQGEILGRASRLVRPGGRLAYATCSVLPVENAQVAAAFAAVRPDFRPVAIASAARTPALTDAARTRIAALAGDGHTLQMTPRRTGTDGFFVALFERRP